MVSFASLTEAGAGRSTDQVAIARGGATHRQTVEALIRTFFTATRESKLDGIEAGAEVNLTGTDLQTAIDTATGGTVWRSAHTILRSAIQTRDLLDGLLGTGWRTGSGGSSAALPPAQIGSGVVSMTNNAWTDFPITEDIERNREYQFIVQRGADADAIVATPTFYGSQLLDLDPHTAAGFSGNTESDQLGLAIGRIEEGGAVSMSVGREDARTLLVRCFLNGTYRAKELWKLPSRGGDATGGITLDQAIDGVGAALSAIAEFTYDAAANTFTFALAPNSVTAAQMRANSAAHKAEIRTRIEAPHDPEVAKLAGATFTGPAKGVTPVADEDFATKGYADSLDRTPGTPPREITAGAGSTYTLLDAENEIHVDVAITHNTRGTRTYTDRILRAELTGTPVAHVLDGRNPSAHAGDSDNNFVGFSASISGNVVTLTTGNYQGTITKVWGIVSGAPGPKGDPGTTDLSAQDHGRISDLEERAQELTLEEHEAWADETAVTAFAVHLVPSGTAITTDALPGYAWGLTAAVPSAGDYIPLLRAATGRDRNAIRVRRVDSSDDEQATYRGGWRFAGLEQGGFDYYIRAADTMAAGDVLTVQRVTADAHTRYNGEVTKLEEHEANPGAHQDSPRRQATLGLNAPVGRRVYLTETIAHPPVEHIFSVPVGDLRPNDGRGIALFAGASVLDFSAAPVNGPEATLDTSGLPAVMNARRVAAVWQNYTGDRRNIYFVVADAGALSGVTPTHIHISGVNDVRAAIEQVGNAVVVSGTSYRIMRTTGVNLTGHITQLVENGSPFLFSLQYAAGYLTETGTIDAGVDYAEGEYESLGPGEWIARPIADFASELGDYTLKATYRPVDYGLAAYTAGPAAGRLMFNNATVADATALKLRPHVADSVALGRRMRNDATLTILVGATEYVATVTAFTHDIPTDTYEITVGSGTGRPNLLADSQARVSLNGQWEAQVDARATTLIQQSQANTRREVIRAVPQSVRSYGAFSPGDLVGGVPRIASGSSYSDDGPTPPTSNRWHRLPADAIAAANGRPLWEEVLPVAYDATAGVWGVAPPLYVRIDDVGAFVYTSNPNAGSGSDVPPTNWTHFAVRAPDGTLGPWIPRAQGPAVETLILETGVRNFPSQYGVLIDVPGGGFFDLDNFYALRGEIRAYGPADVDGNYPLIYFQDAILDEHGLAELQVWGHTRRTATEGMLRVALGGPNQVASLSIVHQFHTTSIADWQQSGLGNPGIFTELIFQTREGRERQLREFDDVFLPAHARGAGNFKLYGLSRG